MKIAGWILFAVGLALLAWAFVYDPSFTPNPAQYWDRTVNLGLLAEKTTIGIIGGALTVAGAVVGCAGVVADTVRTEIKRALSRRDPPAAE